MSDKINIIIKEEAINLNIGAGGAGGVAGGGVALRGAGTYIQETGTVRFFNSNSVTFGLSTNGLMTASFSQSTHDHPYLGSAESSYYQTSNLSSVFLITAAESDHTHSQYVNTSISSQWLTTAMASQNTSLFEYTTHTSAITSAALHTSNSTLFAGVGTSGTNVTMTLNSNGLALSVDPPGAGGGAALQGSGTYTQNSGTIQFANSNGVTFGLTENQMTVSYSQSTHEHPYVNTSVSSNFLTTAAASDHTHDQYVNTSVSSNFLTDGIATDYTSHTHDYQSTGAYLTTAAESDHTHDAYINTSISSNFLTTAALSDHTHDQYINTSVSSQWLTTAAESDHTHSNYIDASVSSQWLTTAAESDHTHSEYVNTSISSQWLTTAMASENTSLFFYVSDSGAFQLTSDNSLSLGTGYTTHTHDYAATDHTHSAYLPVGNSTDYATSVLSNTFQTTGAYLTTAALSNHTHSDLYIPLGNSTEYATSVLSDTFLTTYTAGGFEVNISGNTSGTVADINSGTLTLVGGDNITLSQSGNELVVIGAASGTAAGIAIQGGSSGTWGATEVISSGTVVLYGGVGALVSQYGNEFVIMVATDHLLETSVSSRFQLTSATSAITASAVNTSVTSQWLTTAAASDHTHDQYVNTSISSQWLTGYTESTHDFTQYVGLLTTSIDGGSATINSSQLLLSIPTIAGTLGFQDSNGVTFGVASTTSNSSTVVTASIGSFAASDHTHSDLYIPLANSTDYASSVLSGTFQTTGAYLTTAPGTGSTLTTTAGTDLAVTYNSDGLQIAYPAWLTTAATGGGAGADWSISSTAGTDVVISTASDTITFYQPAFITTAMASNAGSNFVGLATTEITGGSATINSSQLLLNIPNNAGSLGFADSNGISFGVASTTSNSSTVVTASFGLAWELYGNTTGTSSSVVSVLKLSAGTNITLSGGSGGITIVG